MESATCSAPVTWHRRNPRPVRRRPHRHVPCPYAYAVCTPDSRWNTTEPSTHLPLKKFPAKARAPAARTFPSARRRGRHRPARTRKPLGGLASSLTAANAMPHLRHGRHNPLRYRKHHRGREPGKPWALFAGTGSYASISRRMAGGEHGANGEKAGSAAVSRPSWRSNH